jgi:hypothetical protein
VQEERIFPEANIPTKAEDYHGTVHFERILPDLAAKGVGSINLEIPFAEALKLSLALQSCLMALNRYHRGTVAGREMGVLLAINVEGTSIGVIEKRVEPTA